MTWFFAVLIVLALGGVAAVAAGRGTPLAEAYDDRPDALVPATGRLSAADLRGVRFSIALRGYRMSEVDALLDRLAAERDQDEHPQLSGHDGGGDGGHDFDGGGHDDGEPGEPGGRGGPPPS